jgi:putative transposase
VHHTNHGVYGARKVWLALNREGGPVARCTVELLMRELGPQAARRRKRLRTTITDPAAARPAGPVQRRVSPARPDAVWGADFTSVPTWSGTVDVVFVLDVHSRRILGWRAATSMDTERRGGSGRPARKASGWGTKPTTNRRGRVVPS